MLTKEYTLDQIVKMVKPSDLRILSIVKKAGDCLVPKEFLLNGFAIDKYSLALISLRFICGEINKRKHNGIVMPRVIVSIADADGLKYRCENDEISELLAMIENDGIKCGVELSA